MAKKQIESQPDKYLEMVRALPRPSLEQTYRFAWFVAGAHSWYKHLPAYGTVPFVFYLDPCAGYSTTTICATGEVVLQEITDESDCWHYSMQTTADYHRRFGHWSYDRDTPGEGASISDGEGNWIAVPRPLLEAGKAEVNAFMHVNMINWFWKPAPGEEPPKFLNDPAAAAFGKEGGSADRLAAPYQAAVDEWLRRATAGQGFDESWEEAFAAMSGTGVELDAALASFQRKLLLTWAAQISDKVRSREAATGKKRSIPATTRRSSRKGVANIPLAFAYERNRQLDEMRHAMLRVLELIDGHQDDTARASPNAQSPTKAVSSSSGARKRKAASRHEKDRQT